MKIVTLKGGLGNQLFGLAFAHSISVLTGEDVGIDISGYPEPVFRREFELGQLVDRIEGVSAVHRPFAVGKTARSLLKRLPAAGYYFEPRKPPSMRELEGAVRRARRFEGYWQNEAYIVAPDDYRRLVRAFVASNAAVFAADPFDVIIHYRTYQDQRIASRAKTPNADYFSRAFKYVTDRLGASVRVGLISDDPTFAMNAIGEMADFAVPVLATEALTDMSLMFSARALLLSNSSFSWWGGYCSDASVVTYPTQDGYYHYPSPAARFTLV